jgi:hypothetical protein
MEQLVVEHLTLRFAVGTFDRWRDVQATVSELTAAGVAQSSFSCLGHRRVLGATAADEGMTLRELPFPGNREPIAGTAGPLSDRLAARLAAKSDTLASALGSWLIPRHAAQIEQAVAADKIILWVQLFDTADELRAYRSLLARSSNSVGVHDLA